MDRFRTKQPAEAYFVEFDFEDKIGTAVTIASAVVSAKIVSTGADATATITTVGSQTISGQSVYVWVKAGTSGVDYQITCVATGDDASVHELEGLMLVLDVPATATTGTGPGLVSPPVIEPVSLGEVKEHLKVDSADEDELISYILITAREYVEDITRRALLTQTWDYCLRGWPTTNYFKLPYGNLQTSGLSVKWKDTDGTETTLTLTTDYLIETNGEGIGRIVLPYGQTWPSGTLYPSNPITVRFTCGWTTAANVPFKIKAAIKMICADLYENREAQIESNTVYHSNQIVQRLLASARLWDEF